ncbi:MAG: alpha-ketoacid dehydrogenase subunit beta [Deltaproteobacteria bacterium]|nr:alpha-ketoacid dehydrogenase subunit beta [Deltaproteobacteria bacterium]
MSRLDESERELNVLGSLNGALHSILGDDDRVVVLGEDLLDPYGGAFKVTRGLSDAYPDRVLTTPISEAGFTGVAVGMAMRGLRPVVEIMFGDFLMLAADQLLNHASKYTWMYEGKVDVPLVVRTPMGGRRGYGPTHSQSIEKHFIGMPGLVVVAPSVFHDPGALLRTAVVDDDRPVLFVENKLMYARPLRRIQGGRVGDMAARVDDARYPTVTLSYDDFRDADVTLVAYGGMAELAARAAERLLLDDEVVCEIVLPSSLNPLDLTPVRQSLARSGRLVVCEEAAPIASWGSEMIARVSAEAFDLLEAAPVKVAARNLPIANTRDLERAILPQESDIVAAVTRAIGSHTTPVHLAG